MTVRLRSLVLAAAVLLAALPAGATPRGLAEVETRLVDLNGGVYGDRPLVAYVRKVGMRLVTAAGRQDQPWRFTLLDTPDANAFALPGGRIFLTRGMLALADDEAELAAILGHEIGHAIGGDALTLRGDRARRAAEFAADEVALDLMTRAGYDPAGEADFQETLLAAQALEARRDGADPTEARIGDHPALADRLRVARSALAETTAGRGVRNRAEYLAAIDGMVWGDGPAQGFVRGRDFVHPDLRFAIEAPAGYALANRPDAVIATGPAGALLLLDSLPDPGGSPETYLTRGWVPEIARDVQAGPIEALRRISLHGMPAAQGMLPLASRGSARVAELTVVRHGGRFYRLTGLHDPDDATGAAALAEAAASFRSLSAEEVARIRPLRIRIHRVSRGDDIAALAAAMPVGRAPRAQFDLMNGIRPGKSLRVADRVKLATD